MITGLQKAGLIAAVILLSVLLYAGVRLFMQEAAGGGKTEVTLQRIFGGCSDEYAGVTDAAKAVGECGVIQVLVNKFNDENNINAVIVTQGTQSAGYYDRLSAAYAARRPPDVALMHQNMLPDFEERGLLFPLDDLLSQAGVQWNDFVPSVLEAVRFNNHIYALPFDLHVLLWHLNMQLFAQAGLVSTAGAPVLPHSADELIEQGKRLMQRTGKRYFAIPSLADPMPFWTFETLVWQQGDELILPEKLIARLTSPAAHTALGLLASLYDQGIASRNEDYVAAEQTFLRGDAAVLVNGTWVVDSLLAQSKKAETGLKRYAAYVPPGIFEHEASFGGSHLWVLPKQERIDPEKLRAAAAFLKFLYDESAAWARTGHLPVRQSILSSEAFLALPERRNYASAAQTARAFPHIERQTAIGYFLGQEINATWLLRRPPEDSLRIAQEEIEGVLDRIRIARERRAQIKR